MHTHTRSRSTLQRRFAAAGLSAALIGVTAPINAQPEVEPIDPVLPEKVQEQADSFDVVPVEQGGFVAEATGQGRYAADPLAPVQLELERYAGPLEVAEVLVSHGQVSKGQPILKLKAQKLAEQTDDARQSLQRATQSLAWTQQEQAMGEKERVLAAERRTLEREDTEVDFKNWEKFGKADRYLSAELSLQRSEASFADEEQELQQLEELYEGAKLASRTQDIVLDRARRRLKMSQKYLEMTRRQSDVQINVLLPREERDWANRMRWLTINQDHAQQRDKIARQRQALALEQATQAVDDAQEALDELKADAEALQLVAPAGGVMTALGLKPGDKVTSKQVLAQVHSAGRGKLELTVSAADLRVIREGDRAEVNWRAFGEVQSQGTVTLIAWQGEAAGNTDTKYRVTLELDNVDSVIRPGMLAEVVFKKPLENQTLSVPVDAVARDEDGAYCMVRVGEGFERRAVVTGAGNDQRVQVLRGLTKGDEVRVPAEQD